MAKKKMLTDKEIETLKRHLKGIAKIVVKSEEKEKIEQFNKWLDDAYENWPDLKREIFIDNI